MAGHGRGPRPRNPEEDWDAWGRGMAATSSIAFLPSPDGTFATIPATARSVWFLSPPTTAVSPSTTVSRSAIQSEARGETEGDAAGGGEDSHNFSSNLRGIISNNKIRVNSFSPKGRRFRTIIRLRMIR